VTSEDSCCQDMLRVYTYTQLTRRVLLIRLAVCVVRVTNGGKNSGHEQKLHAIWLLPNMMHISTHKNGIFYYHDAERLARTLVAACVSAEKYCRTAATSKTI
jgi:hypothetical protein